MAIETPNAYHNTMDAQWQMMQDLCGGTKVMRSKGEQYLPRNKEEGDANYTARLNRTFLFPGTENAISRAASKPHSRPVTIEELPTQLDDFTQNMDGQGRDATQFSRQVFEAGIKYGATHVLISYPTVINADKRTVADDMRDHIDPYCVHITPPNMLGWKTIKVGARHVLQEVRFKDRIVTENADYETVTVDAVRVIRPTDWELWVKKADDKSYILEDQGAHTLGEIGLRTFYVDQDGFMTAGVPYKDLASLNVQHWQSDSDYNNNLYYAGQVMLGAAGISQKEMADGFVLGPSRILKSTNPTAKFGYVEHTAKATGALRTRLQDNEEKQELLGVQPFIRRSLTATATSQTMHAEGVQADIEAWIRSCELFFGQVFEVAAKWKGVTLAEGFKFNIYSDFAKGLMTDTDLKHLLEMKQGGSLSLETHLAEAKRRGLLSENVDIDEEMSRIEKEAGDAMKQSMALLEAQAGADEDDDEDDDGNE